jgi:hypothetical protein
MIDRVWQFPPTIEVDSVGIDQENESNSFLCMKLLVDNASPKFLYLGIISKFNSPYPSVCAVPEHGIHHMDEYTSNSQEKFVLH